MSSYALYETPNWIKTSWPLKTGMKSSHASTKFRIMWQDLPLKRFGCDHISPLFFELLEHSESVHESSYQQMMKGRYSHHLPFLIVYVCFKALEPI